MLRLEQGHENGQCLGDGTPPRRLRALLAIRTPGLGSVPPFPGLMALMGQKGKCAPSGSSPLRGLITRRKYVRDAKLFKDSWKERDFSEHGDMSPKRGVRSWPRMACVFGREKRGNERSRQLRRPGTLGDPSRTAG